MENTVEGRVSSATAREAPAKPEAAQAVLTGERTAGYETSLNATYQMGIGLCRFVMHKSPPMIKHLPASRATESSVGNASQRNKERSSMVCHSGVNQGLENGKWDCRLCTSACSSCLGGGLDKSEVRPTRHPRGHKWTDGRPRVGGWYVDAAAGSKDASRNANPCCSAKGTDLACGAPRARRAAAFK
jgi:hypothetical protein